MLLNELYPEGWLCLFSGDTRGSRLKSRIMLLKKQKVTFIEIAKPSAWLFNIFALH